MNICYLNHDKKSSTGAGHFLLSIIDAIEKEIPRYNISILTSEDFLNGGLFNNFFNFFKIRSIFKKQDIIHALDGWPYGFIAAFFSIGLEKKIIITAIGSGAVKPLYVLLKKWLLIWAYKKADKVIAISNNTKKEIKKVIPDLNIEVINHGVDFKKFQLPVSNYKLPISKPYILSVGTLKKRKGLDYSIKAFSEIAQDFVNLKYVIVGKGPEREKLINLAEIYNLSKRIIILDGLDFNFLVNLYRNAELFILLPHDDDKDIEGFGLVFLEAAACGLPVVASRDTSAEDAVRNNQNGFLIASDNSTDVAKALREILSDNSLKNKMSFESIKFAKEMSWQNAAQKYILLYDFIISKK